MGSGMITRRTEWTSLASYLRDGCCCIRIPVTTQRHTLAPTSVRCGNTVCLHFRETEIKGRKRYPAHCRVIQELDDHLGYDSSRSRFGGSAGLSGGCYGSRVVTPTSHKQLTEAVVVGSPRLCGTGGGLQVLPCICRMRTSASPKIVDGIQMPSFSQDKSQKAELPIWY